MSPELPSQKATVDQLLNVSSGRASQSRPFDWCLLVILLLVVPALYLPYALHNLPVAANVDERTSLAVLERFHHGSFNPQFFMYPTLYYYVTYFFVWLVGSPPLTCSQILLIGRLLNLAFVGLNAFVTYRFCVIASLSRLAGILAALFVVGSVTITASGAYLCTDVLLAASSMAALYFLTLYFQTGGRQEWVTGAVLMGAAVGCKYTAFLLFIAYCFAEMMVSFSLLGADGRDVSRGRSAFKRTPIIVFLLIVGVMLIGSALAFPTAAALQFVARNRSNPDLRSGAEYLLFFAHLRRLLAAAGVLLVILAGSVKFFRAVYACVALKRMYGGLAIVVLIAYLSTPYSLIDPKRFVYDLGALFRSNIVVASNHAQWGNYAKWLLSNESGVLLVLSVAGIALIIRTAKSHLRLAGIYALLYIYVIGSAHLGFLRYLTPVLPLLYCCGAWALAWLWQRRSSPIRLLTGLLLVAVLTQLLLRAWRQRALSAETDAFLASYQVAVREQPNLVLYAGYAPAVELQERGISTRQISWAELRMGSIGSHLQCGNLLIFDKQAAQANTVEAEGAADVSLLLNDSRGAGQEVMRRTDCR